jgi:Flp pilus assembly secretin CpaC
MAEGSKSRLQFRIATLLWLTFCVASFFGGRYWDRIRIPERRAPVIVPPGVISLRLAAGDALIVKAGVPVQRMLVADPTVLGIVPATQDSFELQAKFAGKTKVEIWDDSTNPPVTYDVTVQ